MRLGSAQLFFTSISTHSLFSSVYVLYKNTTVMTIHEKKRVQKSAKAEIALSLFHVVGRCTLLRARIYIDTTDDGM